MHFVIVVNVVEVVIAEGCREASISSLTSVGQKNSPTRVASPPVFSPSPSWLALTMKGPNG